MKFKRAKENPILKPKKENFWEKRAVFNPGVVFKNGKFYLLYRAIGEKKKYISRLGLAISEDGINFQRFKKPAFQFKNLSVEDPRIVNFEEKFLITFTLGKPHSAQEIFLAETKDFRQFEKILPLFPKITENRDVVLFPEKIGNFFVLLHRPSSWIKERILKRGKKIFLKTKEKIVPWPFKEIPKYFPEKPSIWICFSKNLKDWFSHQVLAEPKEDWEEIKIGAGPPPIKTEKGWILITHGVGKIKDRKNFLKRFDGKMQKRIYRAGFLILDLKDPQKIILRSKKPILEPKKDYEIFGDVPWVVFPTGAVLIKNELFLYYGGGDKFCCLAQAKI